MRAGLGANAEPGLCARGLSPGRDQIMLLQFEGVSRPVSLSNGQALLPVLEAVAPSWPFRRVARCGSDPIISVRGGRGSFRIGSPWLSRIAHDDTAVGAACCLLVDLIHAYVERDAALLCFHCAAVELGGRLAIFPSTVRAGKTTLAARLAADGFRIFADDALPVVAERAQGIALGIAPRLRLPLPKHAGARFRNFVQTHAGPSDRRYLYLSLPPAALAGYGSRAPLGAVVLLERKPSGPAQLAAAPRGRALEHLIVQNFAPGGTSIAAVDRLHALVARLPCFALSYSDLDEAAGLLRERLGDEKTMSASAPRRSRVGKRPAPTKQPYTSAPRGGYRQTAGVHLRDIDGDLFLVHPKQDGVFHLDPIAAALWWMLARPTTIAAATGTLCQAFPGVDKRRIARDVKKTFAALRRGGLIRHQKTRRKPRENRRVCRPVNSPRGGQRS